MHCRCSIYIALTALACALPAASARAHIIPGSNEFTHTLPGDFFTGQIMSITYIGPPVGENVWHAYADFTWVSTGGTAPSDVAVHIEVAVEGGWQEWTITGADFGWTAAPNSPGVYHGTLDTDILNGTVIASGPFGGSIMKVFIAAADGGGLAGGQFVDSTFTLTMAPIPAPPAIALFAIAAARRRRRRRRILADHDRPRPADALRNRAAERR